MHLGNTITLCGFEITIKGNNLIMLMTWLGFEIFAFFCCWRSIEVSCCKLLYLKRMFDLINNLRWSWWESWIQMHKYSDIECKFPFPLNLFTLLTIWWFTFFYCKVLHGRSYRTRIIIWLLCMRDDLWLLCLPGQVSVFSLSCISKSLMGYLVKYVPYGLYI